MAIQIRQSTSLNPRQSELPIIRRTTKGLIKERDAGDVFLLTTEGGKIIAKERR